uniref:Uncharacterized protein n=1 Tax=Oryza barthii TaxID=65489 RepID=A0A0D3G806_9ORYZ
MEGPRKRREIEQWRTGAQPCAAGAQPFAADARSVRSGDPRWGYRRRSGQAFTVQLTVGRAVRRGRRRARQWSGVVAEWAHRRPALVVQPTVGGAGHATRESSTVAEEWRSGVGAAADEAPRRFLARVADLRRRRIMGFGGEARFLAWEWDNEATGRDATQGRTGEGMNAACGRSA